MRFSQVGVVAALGAVVQSFLIPPTITPADNELIKMLPVETTAIVDERQLAIECPGCPVDIITLDGQTKSATSHIDSMLRFNFSISHGDKDLFMLNDVQLYPIDAISQSFMEPLTADQLVKTMEGRWNYAASPKLGYALSIQHPTPASSSEPMGLVALRLEIVEIGQNLILGFPVIEAKLVETGSGQLMIGSVETIRAQTMSSTLDQECTSIACKWRAIIADKISKLKGLKGCSGMKRPQPESSAHPAPAKPIHHGHPRPAFGAHRPHHHHHRHSGFAKFLRGLVFHVFIPIMIGVVTGIMASIVGMVVGHIAIFVWRLLFRRGQFARCHRQHEESISINDEDAKSLLGNDNPPPVYEEAPAYEGNVSDEKA